MHRDGECLGYSIRSVRPHPRYLPLGPRHPSWSGPRSLSAHLPPCSHCQPSSSVSSFATWIESLRLHVSPIILPPSNTTSADDAEFAGTSEAARSPTTLLYGIRSCWRRHGGRRVTQRLPHKCIQPTERGSNRASKGAFVDVLTWQLVSRLFRPTRPVWRTH
jgi:hypothetical protein